MELGPPVAAANGGPPRNDASIDRDAIVKPYEAQLRQARVWARIVGFCYALCRFLAFCNLTWATVALLGAFLPGLLPLDFGLVSSLIFVEAGRLASASFFMRLLKRPLAHSSQDPRHMRHDTDLHYALSRRARFCSNVLQFILLAPSFVMPIIGQIFLRYGSLNRNLQVSLRIFYSVTAFNSVVSLVYLVCSALAFAILNKPPEQSVLRYFDTVLQQAMDNDLVQADDFEFFQFAYSMLGAEFRRNVQPEAVAKNHKQLIHYMFAHRLGVDFLEIYLDANDAFVRLAAANMVGFWADRTWGVGLPEKLKLAEETLTKLADKVSMSGQVGWAATTSFGALGSTRRGTEIVAGTRTSSNEGLPARLVHLVDDSSDRSLAPVRTLRAFYEQLCVDEQGPPHAFGEAETSRLEEKLRRLAASSRVHRLRVQAAYLLLLMEKRLEDGVVLAIEPTTDAYWFRSEVMMLELLRSRIDDAPALQLPSPRARVREDTPITPPPWARPNPSHVLPNNTSSFRGGTTSFTPQHTAHCDPHNCVP